MAKTKLEQMLDDLKVTRKAIVELYVVLVDVAAVPRERAEEFLAMVTADFPHIERREAEEALADLLDDDASPL